MTTTDRALRAALLASACGLALGTSALAQDQIEDQEQYDEDDVEEVAGEPTTGYGDVITVTGYRASVERSLDLKRNSSAIVEAISAEDIGKLPDVSIAESLGRLPGLAAQRLRGRAQVISVRGLGPDFTYTLLNGREQVTAGDNRGVEFDQYPAELLQSAVVYKTPTADLIGQGLAGTVDLRTIRPLDYSERRITGSARYEYNDLDVGSDSEDGYRFTGFYVDQFMDDRLGIVLGVALQSSPTQAERFEAWGYPQANTDAFEIGDDITDLDEDGLPDNGVGVIPGSPFVLGGAKPYIEGRDLERNSFIGTLQYEPTDRLKATFDGFYSEFEDGGVLRGVEFPLFWGGRGLERGTFTVDPSFGEPGLVDQGFFVGAGQDDDDDGDIDSRGRGVAGVIRNDLRRRDSTLLSLGGNLQFRPSDDWLLEADVSYSGVDRDDIDLETYSSVVDDDGEVVGADRFGFAFNGEYFVFDSPFDYSDASSIRLADPGNYGQLGFLKEPNTEDELLQVRLTAENEVESDYLSGVKFGLNYTTRDKQLRSDEAFLRGDGTLPIPQGLIEDGPSLDFLQLGDVIAYDPQAVFDSGVYDVQPNQNADVITKAYDVSEDVLTFYAQANIDWVDGPFPVTGNIGTQILRTDQRSQGARVNVDESGGFIEQLDQGDTYTNVLPSLNLQVEVADRMFVRFGAARTLARARVDQLRASQTLGFDSSVINLPTLAATNGIDLDQNRTFLTISGGNPDLKPYKADSLDLSYEWYFAEGGSIAIAGFYKWLDDFVYDGPSGFVDLSDVIDAIPFASILGDDLNTFIDENGDVQPVTASTIRALNPDVDTALLSRPINGEGGNLKGFEVSVNFPLSEFVEGPLGGFGVNASYSYTDSEIDPGDGGEPIDIPGLSTDVANLTLFYEYEGFEARSSARYRSDFLGELTGFGAGREFRTIGSETVIDAQIGYRFQDGTALDGLAIILQANNLTNEEFTTTQTYEGVDIPRDYQRYGTTYLLGVSYDY